MTRISRDEMFMRMAEVASLRSTCRRAHVGTVITNLDGTTILGIGYNGNARGLQNDCDFDGEGKCGCIHAEVNAILKAPYHEGDLTLYTTTAPCYDCAKLVLNSRVTKVLYRTSYRRPEGVQLLEGNRIQVEKLEEWHADQGVFDVGGAR